VKSVILVNYHQPALVVGYIVKMFSLKLLMPAARGQSDLFRSAPTCHWRTDGQTELV